MMDVRVFDHVLGMERREKILDFLNDPRFGWVHGAFSSPDPEMPRYMYKHFAGFRQKGTENITPDMILEELSGNAPILRHFWNIIAEKWLRGHVLSRCYANAMPVGIGGGVHQDSPHRDHLTAIYFPQSAWSYDEGGETLFFSHSMSEVVKAVVPKPDRLVVFPGNIPHVARPVYRKAKTPRITLMYKTLGRAKAGSHGSS